MPLDKFDIKIQEAAKNLEPEFKEEAWLKMEKLLDVHLPEKKDDRRRFAWLFLFLFSLIAILFLIIKPWNIDGRGLLYPKGDVIIALANKIGSDEKKLTGLKENISGETKEPQRSSFKVGSSVKVFSLEGSTKNKISEGTLEPTGLDIASEKAIDNDNKVAMENPKASNNNIEFTEINNTPATSKKISAEDKPAGKVREDIKFDSTGKTETAGASKAKNKSSKNKNGFGKSFMLNFSLGPDLSAVNPENIGRVNPVFGAGLGYRIGKSWLVRTGFYVTNKAYKAEISDYHPPASFWNYYPDLEYIDANCKVYEVPLILNYNFKQTAKHTWFGSAGISSYFMKKEKYFYYPKDASVTYPRNSYTITNKNKHFLSSLRLSGGYATTLNRNVSFITEPYINLPLSGVGFGKVKLYSAGVLFTLSVKPFEKK